MKTGTARYAQHYEIATYGESRVREGYAHWSGTFALGNFDSNSDLEIASCVLGSMYKGSGVKYYCRFWFSDITIKFPKYKARKANSSISNSREEKIHIIEDRSGNRIYTDQPWL